MEGLSELTGNGSISPLDLLALTDTFDSPAILRPLLALCIGPWFGVDQSNPIW